MSRSCLLAIKLWESYQFNGSLPIQLVFLFFSLEFEESPIMERDLCQAHMRHNTYSACLFVSRDSHDFEEPFVPNACFIWIWSPIINQGRSERANRGNSIQYWSFPLAFVHPLEGRTPRGHVTRRTCQGHHCQKL